MTSETVYSVEPVSRMTYLSANSLRGTYTGTLRRNAPLTPVTTGKCPLNVPLAGKATARTSATISFFQGSEKVPALLNGK